MALSTVTTSDGITIDILERGLFGNKRYVIGEITNTSDGNDISYTTGGVANLQPKLFGLDRIDRVNFDIPPNVRNNVNFNAADKKLSVYQFPDFNDSSTGLDTMFRQSTDDISFLSSISAIGATATTDRIYILSSAKVFVYDWSGNRQNSEEFDLESNGSATANSITVLSGSNNIYIGYDNGDIHSYYHEPHGGSHRSEHQQSVPLHNISLSPQYISFDDDNDRIYVARSTSNSIQVYNQDGDLQYTRNVIPTIGSNNTNFVRGIAVHDDKLYVADRANRLHAFSLSTSLDKTVSLHNDNNNPQGIAVNEDRIFSYDSSDDKIYLYQRSDGAIQTDEEIDVDGFGFSATRQSIVAVGDDDLYALDSVNHDILKFTKQSDDTWDGPRGIRLTETITATGTGSANDIALYNGHIYLIDVQNDAVRVYNPTTHGRNTSLEIGLHSENDNPRGIAVSATRIYVGDANDSTVYVYDHSGQRQDGTTYGTGDDAVTTTDEEFPISSNNVGMSLITNRLYIIYPNRMVFVHDLAGVVQADDGFTLPPSVNNSPNGIYVDTTNSRIYVGDNTDDKVFVYNLSGERQSSGDFDLTVSSNNNVSGLIYDETNEKFYITNHNSNRVQVYEEGLIPEFSLNSLNDNPDAIAASSNRIYVYDNDNPRIFAYNHSGARQLGDEFNLSSTIKASSVVDMDYDEVNDRFYIYGSTGDRVFVYDSNGNRHNSEEFTYDENVTGIATYGGQLYFSVYDDSGSDDEVAVYNLYYSRIDDLGFDLVSFNSRIDGLAYDGTTFYVAGYADTVYIDKYDNDGNDDGDPYSLQIDNVIDITVTDNLLYALTNEGGVTGHAFIKDSGVFSPNNDIFSAESGHLGIGYSRGHVWLLRSGHLYARNLNGDFPPVDLPNHPGVIDLGSRGDNAIYILSYSEISIVGTDGASSGSIPLQGRTPGFMHVNSSNRIFIFDADNDEIININSGGNKIGQSVEVDTANANIIDLISDVANNRIYAVDSSDTLFYAYAIMLDTTTATSVEYADSTSLDIDDFKGIKLLIIGI